MTCDLGAVRDPKTVINHTGIHRAFLRFGVEVPAQLLLRKTIAAGNVNNTRSVPKTQKGRLDIERKQVFAPIHNHGWERGAHREGNAGRNRYDA